MNALVATITEARPLTQSKGENPHTIKNLRLAIAETNAFGLSVVRHVKAVLFDAVAKTAEKLDLKEGDHVFLEDFRVEKRTYVRESDGKSIQGEDLIPNIMAKISAEQYAEISKKLAAQDAEEAPKF